MSESKSHIPTEVYLDFLGETIPIHWDYHAILMVGIWFVLVPLCIISIRFFKPKPSLYGITKKISPTNILWWWFTVHKFGLYLAVALAVAGVVVALVVSQGFSGSMHAIFGLATVVLGCLQVISSWFRGKHGGKYYATADPADPETWKGDHYNMTPRRRRFEAYHKSAGYLTLLFAAGAAGSGLMQYAMPVLAGVLLAAAALLFILWLVLTYQGRVHDGYRAVFGYGLEHPYNEARKEL
ncbi:MAG: hypothetical protein HQ483_07295 [Rhodospirillales bacterium]|nr:hypothetical protein [Rhodospirillales bacterium]